MLSSSNTIYNPLLNYTPLRSSRLRRVQSRKAFQRNILMAFVFVLLASVSAYFFLYNSEEKSEYVQASAHVVISPVAPTTVPITPTSSVEHLSQATNSSTLESIVQKELEGTKGTYAFAIKNLKTGESYYFNEHKKFQTASLYKVWIMAVVYEQIKAGTLSMDDEVEGDVAALNQRFQIATEDAELKEGFMKFTVREALDQMITNSHNYASLLLSLKIRLSNVANFLQKHRLVESSIGQPPKTNASDIALFFEKLYKGEIIDQHHTAEMIALLKRQNLNNVLPKYIPPGVSIAHKTGQLFTYAHDAGIFYLENGDYIMVGMSDSGAYQGAEDRIAKVSEAVYKYFSEK